MKYELTTEANGSLSIKAAACFQPPLGLTLPASQDVRYSLAGSAALESLIQSSSPELPSGLQIHTLTDQYIFDGTEWLDMSTEDPAGSTMISGAVTFRNSATYGLGITW